MVGYSPFPELDFAGLCKEAKKWAQLYPSIRTISLHHPYNHKKYTEGYVVLWRVLNPYDTDIFGLEFQLTANVRKEFFNMEFAKNAYISEDFPERFPEEWRIELADYHERTVDGLFQEDSWLLFIRKTSSQYPIIREYMIETRIRETHPEVERLFQTIWTIKPSQRREDIFFTAIREYEKNSFFYPNIKKDYLEFFRDTSLRSNKEKEQAYAKLFVQILLDSGVHDVTQRECTEMFKFVKKHSSEQVIAGSLKSTFVKALLYWLAENEPEFTHRLHVNHGLINLLDSQSELAIDKMYTIMEKKGLPTDKAYLEIISKIAPTVPGPVPAPSMPEKERIEIFKAVEKEFSIQILTS